MIFQKSFCKMSLCLKIPLHPRIERPGEAIVQEARDLRDADKLWREACLGYAQDKTLRRTEQIFKAEYQEPAWSFCPTSRL